MWTWALHSRPHALHVVVQTRRCSYSPLRLGRGSLGTRAPFSALCCLQASTVVTSGHGPASPQSTRGEGPTAAARTRTLETPAAPPPTPSRAAHAFPHPSTQLPSVNVQLEAQPGDTSPTTGNCSNPVWNGVGLAVSLVELAKIRLGHPMFLRGLVKFHLGIVGEFALGLPLSREHAAAARVLLATQSQTNG